MIAHAKSNPQVDAARLLVAGKSLGTLVSYSIFTQDRSLVGLILLTPICTDHETKEGIGEESYPALASHDRAIAIILGNQDPLCSVPQLYDFLKNTRGNVSVNVFGGGHGLTFCQPGDPANEERNAKNVEAAVGSAAQWASLLAL